MSGPWQWLRRWWRPEKTPLLGDDERQRQVEEQLQELRLRMNVNRLLANKKSTRLAPSVGHHQNDGHRDPHHKGGK
jgi:hypothetical protein